MDVRVGIFSLLILSVACACAVGELLTFDISTSVVIDEISVAQVSYEQTQTEAEASIIKKNRNLCTLCEEFASQALVYLSQNKTQTEVLTLLHVTCSRLHSLETECITLVDYYAPLFFLEVNQVKPTDFCQKANLCGEAVLTSPPPKEDSCALCHYAIDEMLLKLKDPDTQLEIIEVLLKACDSMQTYAKKCKRMVFEYGPLILANSEQFLEATDVCKVLRACDQGSANTDNSATLVEASLLSDS